MARILFIVNDHPNEAFAITVAKRTAEQLKAAGQELIWVKVPAEETLLGRVIRGKPLGKETSFQWTQIRPKERAKKLIEEKKPAVVYNFHCTPAENIHWKQTNADYTIVPHLEWKGIQLMVVEIKAQYKKIPERALRHIKKYSRKIDESSKKRYLESTTSHRQTLQAGLTPEEFGKAIAIRISKDVQALARKRSIKGAMGRIRGRYPAPKAQTIKRVKIKRRI